MSRRVVLAYDRLRPEERLLLDAFERLGQAVEELYVPGASYSLSCDGSPGRGRAFADALVLERCTARSRALAVTRLAAAAGGRAINDHQVIATCGDKLSTSAELARHGVPTPRTGVAFDLTSALELCREFGYPVVLKPLVGSWGRLVSRLSDADALAAVIEHKAVLGGPDHKVVYLQEHVDKPGRDIRAFVTSDARRGEHVFAAIYRSSDHWITNTARGATASNCPVSDELSAVVGAAARAVGGGVLAVDLVESDRGLLVVEVNHSMEFRNSSAVTGVDIPLHVASWVVEQARA